MTDTPPTGPARQRVTVTHPRTTAARRHAPYTPRSELRAMTPIGAVFLRSLVRSQLRLSVAVLIGLALVIGALPVLGALSPAILSIRVLDMPVAWLLLGVLVFPALVAGGAWYVRAAEHTERQFLELFERR